MNIMKTNIRNFQKYGLLLMACALLTGCVRNELPEKRSTSKTKIDHLMIKEVFYAGHYWVRDVHKWGLQNLYQMYNDDQYIIIYNPTSEVKYLDGLALCTNAIDPTNSIQFAPKDDFVGRYYGAAAVSYFPGKGTEHPVRPGQEIVVAKYAIDHKAKFIDDLVASAKEYGEEIDLSMYKGLDAFLDLSKADFEWTQQELTWGGKNNPNVPDMQPILIVTDKKGKKGPEHQISDITEHNGIALIRLPWTPEDFKANYLDTKDRKGYLHYITVTSSAFADFYAIEIPFANVIDCITVCPRSRFQMRPSKLDKGYNAVTDVDFSSIKQSDLPTYSGLALTRKWDGRKFVDDDNTKTDFETKVASLSRKDKKGNPIK